jgi:hypothetical protein
MRAIRWAAASMAAFLLTACTPIPKIPAKGVVFGEVIDTTVDSKVAQYYMQTYLQGQRADPDLDRRIDALTRQYASALPSRDELAAISADYSVDFAALFFADRLLSSDCNRQLNRRFNDYLATSPARRAAAASYQVLFVPGWDYTQNGHVTGADFKAPRRLATEFGLENHLVPLAPTGSVEDNATVLANEVTRRAASGKKILIAGASSAGPSIHVALAERLTNEDRRAVKAWLNLGGILQGSPLIDLMQRWPQVWLFDLVAWSKDWNRDAISSMAAASSRARFQRLRIEGPLLTINYLGVPLSGQLSKFASDKYPLMRSAGPNDGLTLLADAIAPNSLTVVALGRDHFFAEDPRINEKTVAMMALIVDTLESGGAVTCKG